MQVAAPQGDFVTPTLMGAGESDTARDARVARAPVRDAGQRRGARRAQPQDDGRMAGAVDAGQHRRCPDTAADLVAARREGHPLRGISGALPATLRGTSHRLGAPTGRSSIGMSGTASDRFKSDRTSSNRAGVTLMNNQVGYVVAEVMRHKDGVTVEVLPSMIRVDGTGKFEIDYEECAEALGWDDFGNDDFEEIMSTHYGRMVVLDDRIIMFANPEDAAEYISFDLQALS